MHRASRFTWILVIQIQFFCPFTNQRMHQGLIGHTRKWKITETSYLFCYKILGLIPFSLCLGESVAWIFVHIFPGWIMFMRTVSAPHHVSAFWVRFILSKEVVTGVFHSPQLIAQMPLWPMISEIKLGCIERCAAFLWCYHLTRLPRRPHSRNRRSRCRWSCEILHTSRK